MFSPHTLRIITTIFSIQRMQQILSAGERGKSFETLMKIFVKQITFIRIEIVRDNRISTNFC